MPNKMLIDATHPEETRVVVVRGNRVEEFDFESAQRKQLRGNIYLAKVTRVEPSLQAAFVEYGGNRHGFLAFSEIQPDYYQIPVADRQALIEDDERAHREAEEESENRSNRRRPRHRNARRRGGERVRSDVVDQTDADPSQASHVASGATDVGGHEPSHDITQGEAAEAGFAYGDHESHAHHESETHDHGGVPAAGAHEAVPLFETAPASSDPTTFDHDRSVAPQNLAPQDVAPQDVASTTETHAGHDETHAEDHGSEHHHDAGVHEAAAQESGSHEDAPHDSAPHDDIAHDDEPHASEHDGDDDDDDDDEHAEEEMVESVGGDDAMEEVPERTFRPRRQYKIQEVIKRRQVMLIQVVKEERGNKGAALTTYLSLAGRYAVLMPNTARGGGISRKITSAQDRNRLKEVVEDLDVPEGMGIILRTAGAARTKPEIKRDFEYLLRMWETVRDLTLKSSAPTLVYEEGSLIKRSIRDLYNKDIEEIQVAGESGYQEARDFMKMLMPTHTRMVKQYRDGQPLFSRMGVESQLDAMFSPTVQLRSGGYIVINQTEALVSIDVNSGRSTREHHIEDTALKTNLEAAEEVARQLRLRDLAGLVVIDFIDMDEKRNNRSVERKMSDCLRQDRARIQVGRISHFGLLEMSRQRIRASVLESSTEPCPHCGGTGHVRSVSSVALQLLRGLEETLMKGATHNLIVRTRTDVALYVLNHKRGHLRDLENGFKVTLAVIADPMVAGQQSFLIDRGEQVHTLEAAKALLAEQVAAFPIEEPFEEDPIEAEFFADTEEGAEDSTENESDDLQVSSDSGETGDTSEGDARRRKRRRRRRGGRDGEPRDATASSTEFGAPAASSADDGEDEEDESAERSAPVDGEQPSSDGSGDAGRRRRRGRRGGRRRRGEGEEGSVAAIADDLGTSPPSEAASAVADFDQPRDTPRQDVDFPPRFVPDATAHAGPDESPREPVTSSQVSGVEVSGEISSGAHGHSEIQAAIDDATRTAPEPKRRRSTIRERAPMLSSDAGVTAEPSTEVEQQGSRPDATPSTEATPDAATAQEPRRAGWWSRRFGGGQ